MGFEKMKSKVGGFRGGTPSQDVLVTFDAADLVDPKRSTGDKDTFKVTHVRGGLGKKAGEQDVVRLDKYEKRDGGKDRPSLFDHLQGKNRVNAATPGTVYLLQGVRRGKDGVLEAHWVRNLGSAMRDPEDKLIVMDSVMTKVVSVAADKDGQYSKNHYLYVIDASRAVRVGGKALAAGEVALTAEDLANPEKMDALIGQPKSASLDDGIKAAVAQQFGGDPGFIMRVVADEAQDRPFNIQFIRPNKKDEEKDEWVSASPEEALEAFKEREPDWYEGAQSNDAGMVEIIPFLRFRAGKSSAERAIEDVIAQKAKDPTNKWPKDRVSERFYGEVMTTDDKLQYRACYADAVTVVRSMDPESGYYFWTDAHPMDRKKFADAEIITVNLSPEVQQKYDAIATERGKFKPRDPKTEQAPEPAEENFGDDPSIESSASPSPGR